jgi:hypothetical protein
MSRNGSGTYSLPAGNPVVTGTTISSTWANNTLTDIQNALTQSVSADGQTPITGALTGPSGTVAFGGVGQTQIPSGTTAQRAASPVNGMIRFNTDLAQYEGYKNGAWSIFGNGAGGTLFSDTVTATQGQTLFTLPTGYVQGGDNLSVYVNGSRQIFNVNYTETSTTSFTFATGLNVGDLVNYTIGASTSLSVNSASVLYNEGGTSAVDTNVKAKLQETVSVKDFGAIGDGVADDTASIQAAVNATSIGGNLYFPAGQYKISAAITINKAITIFGNGPGSEFNTNGSYVIQSNISANAFTLVATLAGYAFSSYGITGVNFQDICIKGTTGSTASGIGCDTTVNSGVYHVRSNSMSNCIVRDFNIAVNYIGICYLNNFFNCKFPNNTTGFSNTQGASGTAGGQTRFFGCNFDLSTNGIKWLLDSQGGDLYISGCTFGDGQIGINCIDETLLSVVGSHFENLSVAGIYCPTYNAKANPISEGCKYITGNQFLSNTASLWFDNKSSGANASGFFYPVHIDGNTSFDALFLKLTITTGGSFNSTAFVLGASNVGTSNGALAATQISSLFQGTDLRKYRYTRQFVFDGTYVSGNAIAYLPPNFIPLSVRMYLTANASGFTALSLGDQANNSRYIAGFNGNTQALNTWLNYTPTVPQFKVTTSSQQLLIVVGTGGMLGAQGVIEVDGYTT